MIVTFYTLSDDTTKLRMTKKKELTLEQIYFEIRDRDTRKGLMDGSITINKILQMESTKENVEMEFKRLKELYNPKLKKSEYNKRYYQKSSAMSKKYTCDCGSVMVNRKQVIEKHENTKKHLNSLRSTCT